MIRSIAIAALGVLPSCALEFSAGKAPRETAAPGLASVSVDAGLAGSAWMSAGSIEDLVPGDRLMTYAASVHVEVARIGDAIARCRAEVERLGGWIAKRQDRVLVCRVPAAELEPFLASVRAQGRVLTESMEALDVTDQHRDLRIRLENARRARDRLLALLEQASDVEDVLAIEKELQRLTEEIERGEAELAALDERVAFSIVTVAFRAPDDAPATRERRPSPFGWLNQVGADRVARWF